MLWFWVIAASATLLVTVALVLPLLRRRPPDVAEAEDGDRLRLDIFRDRRREIEREHASGRLDAREADQAQQDLLRQLATDLPQVQAASVRHARTDMRSLPATAACALLAIVPTLAFMTYREVGTPRLLESRPAPDIVRMKLPQGHPPTAIAPSGRGDLDALIAGIEQRTREVPQDGEAWAMLAVARKAQGRHPDAVRAFEQAIPRVDPDARLLAEAAESLAMVGGGDFSGRPLAMLERALALDAREPRALWLMAAARFRAGDLPQARQHLRRFREGLPAGSADAAQVDQLVARIDARKAPDAPPMQASSGASERPPGDEAPPMGGAVVAGTIVVDPSLAKQAERGGTLFLIAREAGGPPIPVAVRREPGARLPMPFELGDDNAMTPDRLLSSAGPLVLEARLSRSGLANRQAGDLYGVLASIEPGRTDLTIVIDRVVGAAEETGDGR